MEITIRTLLQVAGVLIALMGATAHADEADDIRKAVMGHEAFVQRCMDDVVDALSAKGVEELVRQRTRNMCEVIYLEINVCMPGDAAKGIEKVNGFMAVVDEHLNDPLTRAQDYDTARSTKEIFERELAALHDLLEGRTNYCDAG